MKHLKILKINHFHFQNLIGPLGKEVGDLKYISFATDFPLKLMLTFLGGKRKGKSLRVIALEKLEITQLRTLKDLVDDSLLIEFVPPLD